MIGASESSERDEPSSPSGLTTEQQAEIELLEAIGYVSKVPQKECDKIPWLIQ